MSSDPGGGRVIYPYWPYVLHMYWHGLRALHSLMACTWPTLSFHYVAPPHRSIRSAPRASSRAVDSGRSSSNHCGLRGALASPGLRGPFYSSVMFSIDFCKVRGPLPQI